MNRGSRWRKAQEGAILSPPLSSVGGLPCLLSACCPQSSAQPGRDGAAGKAVALHQAGALKSTLKGNLFKSQKRLNAMITGLCQFVLESKLDRGNYSEKPRFWFNEPFLVHLHLFSPLDLTCLFYRTRWPPCLLSSALLTFYHLSAGHPRSSCWGISPPLQLTQSHR